MSNTATKERKIGANVLGYIEINAERFRPLGDKILVTWEEANDDLLAGGKLIRPDTFKGQHYTGIVKKVGPRVSIEINEGDRILFDQFSNFEKLWDSKLGRMALISESSQGSAFAIIPYRTKIGGGEVGFNYDAV